MPGFEHRNGGLEKDYHTGCISTDPQNHSKMVQTRQTKIDRISDVLPDLEILGDVQASTLVVGWGGTFGHLMSAVSNLNKIGKSLAFAHFNYIQPLPHNTADVFSKYRKIIVCELNNGQFASYLRSNISANYIQFNKIEGQPFTVSELELFFLNELI